MMLALDHDPIVAQTADATIRERPRDGARRCVASSAAVWLALMGYWALADLLLARFPPGGRPYRPDGWLTHLVFTLLGLASVWCMARTGFPGAWERAIPAARLLLRPALLGVGFGLLAIISERITGATRTLEAALGEPFTVGFPGSLLAYSAGAIVWEAVFLLLPLPPLLWLVSGVALRGRGQRPTFWILAALAAAAEPALQGGALLAASAGSLGAGPFVAYVVQAYAFNLTAAACFRRYGLLAPILLRLAYYLVWHVAYGNFLA